LILKRSRRISIEMARALGIDPGEVRVGIAISDELGMLAHPLETIPSTGACARILEISAAREVSVIVVGIARNMDGSYGPSSEKGRALAAALRAGGARVVEWDERWSTVQARRTLHEAGRSERRQKLIIDQAAAQVILQAWLDGAGGGGL
jgi:putative holliday junction resolvase